MAAAAILIVLALLIVKKFRRPAQPREAVNASNVPPKRQGEKTTEVVNETGKVTMSKEGVVIAKVEL